MESIVKFHQIMPSAIPPMRADKSALGSMPAAAYQYCEALRAASSFGWYLFPPKNIELRWNGAQTMVRTDGTWRVLSNLVDPETAEVWQSHAPLELKSKVPPYLSQSFVPGVIQIWTGLVVQTAPDWSVLVRPLANVMSPHSFECFEGIIETDWFKPVPLFINLRLVATDQIISIVKAQPLFQLQPVQRAAYTTALENSEVHAINDPVQRLSDEEWAGLGSTLRSISPARPPDIGRYGAEVRKRQRSDV
jgi:Family of unknown function (DUF6065)